MEQTKKNSKMLDLNPAISKITLNENRVNIQVKGKDCYIELKWKSNTQLNAVYKKHVLKIKTQIG